MEMGGKKQAHALAGNNGMLRNINTCGLTFNHTVSLRLTSGSSAKEAACWNDATKAILGNPSLQVKEEKKYISAT